MTVREFRSTPELVAEMRKILELPALQTWIETFREDENPMNKVSPSNVTPHGAYILLGEQTGWRQCLIGFLLGGVPLEPPNNEGTSRDQTYADPSPETE